jgi:hypothetical protein
MSKEALLGALNSKTVWIFGSTGIVGLFDWLANHGELVQAVLAAAGIANPAAVMAILGAAGVILRAVTSKSLAEKA